MIPSGRVSNLSILSVPAEGYSRIASCTLTLISTFFLFLKEILYASYAKFLTSQHASNLKLMQFYGSFLT
jgi:hypothetical protein